MNKIYRYIPILSILSIGFMPISLSTSCSCSTFEELNLNDQKQFIKDRTISIMAKNGNYYVFGTAWVISDATKLDTNDYCYYLATNMHVTHSFDRLGGSISYYFADDSLKTSNSFIDARKNEYVLIDSNNIQIESIEKFKYTGSSYVGVYIPAIDLNVIKIDFKNPTGSIKTKFDNLNTYQKQNGFINKFVIDSQEIRNKNKIVGGYPQKSNSNKSSFGGQWESHSFSGNILSFYDRDYSYDQTNIGHSIGNPKVDQKNNKIQDGDEDFYYWDVSPQYMFNVKTSTDFMPEGASGSMLLTQDYEVCGIYWGGWENNKGDFYPSFSLFNTEEKNFLEQYI